MTIIWTNSVGAEYGRITVDDSTESVSEALAQALCPGGEFDNYGEEGDNLAVVAD